MARDQVESSVEGYESVAAPVDEVTDELPDDLQPAEFEGDYEFPDNSRRRVQGAIYLAFASACALVALTSSSNPIVNVGWWWAAGVLAVVGVIAVVDGQRMQLDETAALVRAQQAVGFPVGYASAQQVWRGLRSRPTWRVLVYSGEDVPTRRGLVVVDAINGAVVEQLVQPAEPNELED